MTKATDLIDIHADALREFNRIQSALRDERLQCLQDRRFYSIAGSQWEGPLGAQFENKPKIEVNKIHLAVIRIINEYRNNRITVNFIPKDGSNLPTLSDTCNGLYRADEQDSSADEAYDNAFEEAVGGGYGAFRYRAEYEDEGDEDNDKQRIRIEPIFDADTSVFFNLDAKRQDKSDAKKCFVLSSMSIEDYKDEYEDDPTSWPKAIHQYEFDWMTPSVVYVAEYYVVEDVGVLFHFFKGLNGDIVKMTDEEYQENTDKRKELKATGYKKQSSRKIKQKKVHKYIMSGGSILEDCGYIAGENIPIVPVYGKRWFIDNIERCMGHVRLAKDAQRLKNMQLSKLAEISALGTVKKPIFTSEQMAGHAVSWSEDNIKNYPYLLINAVTDPSGQSVALGPVGFTEPPDIPQAMAALLQITETDIQDLLGNQEAGEQLQSNISGIAVELIQNKLDMQTYIYVSNMAKAIKRGGEIWLSMAKEIYIEEDRKLKTVDGQGAASQVTLNTTIIDPNTDVPTKIELTDADFDVTAEPGPTSASKKAATVRGLMGLLQTTQDPETIQVITSMIMLNMEGEGIQDLRDYFRKKLVTMGVVKPTQEEQQALQAAAQNQQPDPQAQFLMASAVQAMADAKKSQADTVLTAANAEKAHAQTMQILSEIKNGKIDTALTLIQALEESAARNDPANQQQQQPQQMPTQTNSLPQ